MSLIARIRRRPDPALPPYVNESVTRRIEREHGVDAETAQRWFDEARRFLEVCARSREVHSPPELADHAWHAFVLHTRDYAEYCRHRFGRFVHHQPMEGSDPAAYARAYYAVEDRFGPPDPEVWPRPALSRAGLRAAEGERPRRRPRSGASAAHGAYGGGAGCGGGGHGGAGCGGSSCGGGSCGGGGCGGGCGGG